RPAPNDAARRHNRSGVLNPGIDKQGTINAVLLAEERGLNNPIERETVKLLLVLRQNVEGGNNTVISGRGEGNRLRSVRHRSLERAITMQGGRVERLGKRFRNLILKQSHVVAGVSANDLSRHNRDGGDLVRGETLNADGSFGSGLLAALRNPPGSSLAGRDDDFLSRSAERHLTGKLHHRRCITGLFEIVLGLGGLNEPAKGASGSRRSLCHNYSCVSPRVVGLVNAKRATQRVLKFRAVQCGLSRVQVVNNHAVSLRRAGSRYQFRNGLSRLRKLVLVSTTNK